ncbi:HupE/UreJ family protein [Roseateles amylovorans]|uniref:HupE/UreJ family protein n=1 Tax=Roseateles amylovorans TaxID=2978473 RepID=A0ABY6B7R0_9BURK|nr:HupE/UreJ family protein [Roseateles amylovorans]UXH79595.1 HupE/UreJ family protein [Roseateles amylovorans]
MTHATQPIEIPEQPNTAARGTALKVAAALCLAAPWVVFAHTGEGAGHDHGLSAGFAHPFTGLDHLAAMLAVGLWSALTQSGRRMLVAPFAFAALLLIGALAGGLVGPSGLPAAGIEPMVAVSVLALGLIAAARWRLGAVASATLVGLFAIFHGLAHGSELQGGAALAGMVAATVLLHGAGLAVGWKLRGLAPVWARLAGGMIALMGLGLLTRMVIA